MTQPEYTGKDRACDCSPPNICDILAELKAMKDRIENMIVSVQGLPGDHAGNVQLPFAEDISDSTLGISGTFAGGHAVLQVKAIADNADETASNAQDIAQIAADAANSASQSASGALTAAQTADRKAEGASAAAGLALATAEGIGPSVTFDDPSRKLTVEVNGKTAEAVIPGGGGGAAGGVSDVQVSSDASDVYLTVTKDGATDLQEIGAVSASAAGVLTPVQYQEISGELDSLGSSVNTLNGKVKANETAISNIEPAVSAVNGTGSNLAVKVSIGPKSSQADLPLTGSARAGVVSPALYEQISADHAEVEALKGSYSRIYTVHISQGTEINKPLLDTLYKDRMPAPPFPPLDGTILLDVNSDNEYVWIESNNDWLAREAAPVAVATNRTLGVVRGTDETVGETKGSIMIQENGTMHLRGYYDLVDKIEDNRITAGNNLKEIKYEKNEDGGYNLYFYAANRPESPKQTVFLDPVSIEFDQPGLMTVQQAKDLQNKITLSDVVPDVSIVTGSSPNKSAIQVKIGDNTSKADLPATAGPQGPPGKDGSPGLQGPPGPPGPQVLTVSNGISADNKLTTTVNGVSSVPVQLPNGGGGSGTELQVFFFDYDKGAFVNYYPGAFSDGSEIARDNIFVFDNNGTPINDFTIKPKTYATPDIQWKTRLGCVRYVETTDGRRSDLFIVNVSSGGGGN